ncbi:O-antigen ligase family protein [Ligilactobacillus salivarius]|nr:O-antigen ligase family protein [Ligilactobacillus salivarius]WHS05444.1 O-antigen ligase family protein [Ligilactobacillus salivarius]WHS08480.1 O-antigen ligase family protein [Ligilactobacillus salivarius]WHS09357.1 O-antigen ligase family protein [Ligilactobacillus salivarius]WHS19560.1 O-antigen ligase family protein [Ligilactobacillus salivarius]WHS21713.1 O-antigen ligase family protein [Ligilactobacillus salivarius]
MTKAQKYSLTLLYFITPIMYVILPILILIPLMLEEIILLRSSDIFGNKFVLIFINATLYSCISVLTFRLYDLVILVSFMYLFISKKGDLRVPGRIFILLFFTTLITMVHEISSDGLLEVERYIMSMLLVVVMVNLTYKFEELYTPLKYISLAALYNSIMIYFFIYLGKISKVTGSLFASNIYIYNQQKVDSYAKSFDVRMNGFFSDPNKYMVFCFALIIIIELFIINRETKMLRFIIICAAIMSLSRTALIVIAAYIFFKQLYFEKKKSFDMFVLEITIVVGILVILSIIPDAIFNLNNGTYDVAAKLLGRDKTLEMNTSIANDNRIIIWHDAIQYIQQHFLLGNGWLSFEKLLPYPTHNTLLQLILDGGLIFTVGYIIFFYPLFKMKKWYLTLTCYLIPTMLLELADYRMWYFILAIILLGKEKDDKDSIYIGTSYD